MNGLHPNFMTLTRKPSLKFCSFSTNDLCNWMVQAFDIQASNRNTHVVRIETPGRSCRWWLKEAMMAAIQGGAHSIYFGARMQMRARQTNNFLVSDLEEVAKLCASHQVKTYITLNTIIYDHDSSTHASNCGSSEEAGITAVIASDQAVMNYCRKSGMPLHISTQTNITNIETVEFYSAFADVVVMSRELLRQVAEIVREIKKKKYYWTIRRINTGGKICAWGIVYGRFCKCYLSLHSTMLRQIEVHAYKIAVEHMW